MGNWDKKGQNGWREEEHKPTRAQSDLENARRRLKDGEEEVERLKRVVRNARMRACLVCNPVAGVKGRGFHTCGVYK